MLQHMQTAWSYRSADLLIAAAHPEGLHTHTLVAVFSNPALANAEDLS